MWQRREEEFLPKRKDRGRRTRPSSTSFLVPFFTSFLKEQGRLLPELQPKPFISIWHNPKVKSTKKPIVFQAEEVGLEKLPEGIASSLSLVAIRGVGSRHTHLKPIFNPEIRIKNCLRRRWDSNPRDPLRSQLSKLLQWPLCDSSKFLKLFPGHSGFYKRLEVLRAFLFQINQYFAPYISCI